MKNNNENIDTNIDDIVDTIIKLPIKGLEEKIENINTDINSRQRILDSSLSILGEREIELESHLWKMRYGLGDELNRKLVVENELAKVRSTKINISISHFQDSLRLREKLQIAQEELAMEREKRKLIS